MKTKLDLAHDYAMLHMVQDGYKDVDDFEMVKWAVAWSFDRFGAHWWDLKPIKGIDIWVYGQMNHVSEGAPSFGYTGDWKDSLRERPNDQLGDY